MNYFPFHIGDYAVHTRHLSLMEDLAYRRLIDLYYTRESALPVEASQVARLIGMRDNVEDVQAVLSEFFVSTDAGWTHARCDAEITRANEAAERARNNGKRGGRPSQQPKRNLEQTQPVIAGNPDETKSQAPNTQDQDPIPKKEKSTTRASRKSALPLGFGISERVRDWATSRGYAQLDEHLDAFKRKAVAKGYMNVSWDDAFMEAIREDWAKLRGRTPSGAAPAGESATRSNGAVESTQQWIAEHAAPIESTPESRAAVAERLRQAANKLKGVSA